MASDQELIMLRRQGTQLSQAIQQGPTQPEGSPLAKILWLNPSSCCLSERIVKEARCHFGLQEEDCC